MAQLREAAKQTRMTGKIRTIGITMFGIVEILKYQGMDLGVNQEDIFKTLEIITGAIAGIGAVISWGKLIRRRFFDKD